jgi:fatty acid desaturase
MKLIHNYWFYAVIIILCALATLVGIIALFIWKWWLGLIVVGAYVALIKYCMHNAVALPPNAPFFKDEERDEKNFNN